MIKMQNVRKTYPGFDFELSLEIPEGRITGLIGKNGAGKSTAIRLMLGLVKAESGTIELFGKPITEITLQDLELRESGEQERVICLNRGRAAYGGKNHPVPTASGQSSRCGPGTQHRKTGRF